jgi:ABC-type long-subunit fatty acid transport system fused permease/ATPase subunit
MLLHHRVLQIPADKTELFGGTGGDAFVISEQPKRMESVTIRSGDVIDSLAFSYIDQAGNKQSAGPWGDNGGLPSTVSEFWSKPFLFSLLLFKILVWVMSCFSLKSYLHLFRNHPLLITRNIHSAKANKSTYVQTLSESFTLLYK